jgi:hypothetical protein
MHAAAVRYRPHLERGQNLQQRGREALAPSDVQAKHSQVRGHPLQQDGQRLMVRGRELLCDQLQLLQPRGGQLRDDASGAGVHTQHAQLQHVCP